MSISSFYDLLSRGRTVLALHSKNLLHGCDYTPESHTGLDGSCSGEALDKMRALNRYIFTTGSTNNYYPCVDDPEPAWLAAWMPLSVAQSLAVYMSHHPVACIIQDLYTGKVILNSMNLDLHRFWSAEGVLSMETDDRPFLQQCSEELATQAKCLFQGTDPVVGMWLEADDEISRNLYDIVLDYFSLVTRKRTELEWHSQLASSNSLRHE